MAQTHATQDVLARVKKLLELAADPSNEHEAANAAAHAQRLMFKYNIELSNLEGIGADKGKVERDYVDAGYTPGTGMDWRVNLASAIARYGFGSLIIHGTGKRTRFAFIGRKADIEAMMREYEYLTVELTRLLAEYGKAQWDAAKAEAKRMGFTFHEWESMHAHRHPLKLKNSWLHGAAAGVAARLYEEQKANIDEAGEAGTALVVVRGTEIKEAVESMYGGRLGKRSSNGTGLDYGAVLAGRKAGHEAAGRRNQSQIGPKGQLS